MKEINNRRKVLSLLCVLVMLLSITIVGSLVASAEEAAPVASGNVAKIGDQPYATLAAAMAECNKKAGDYTITLLSDSAEVFTFAQKSDVNITIDGDGNTFSGKITLNAGGGNLKFADAKIAPASSQTIYLNASTAPNITFDGCALQGANMDGVIVWGESSYTTTQITIINCTADNLGYIAAVRQGGHNILVENVTATNMIYLLRPLKTRVVTVRNVTCEAVIAIQIRAEADNCKLTIEDCNFSSIEYQGAHYTPVQTHAGSNSIAYDIEIKGVNHFSVKGKDMAGTSWFAGTDGVKVYAPVQLTTEDGTVYICGSVVDAAAEAKSGDTIKLLEDTDEVVEIPTGVTLDKNGKTADNVTVKVPEFVTIDSAQDLIDFSNAVGNAVSAGGKYKGLDVHNNPETIVKLTADIDMEGVSGFWPIGDGDKRYFAGTFDGQGHTISNLYCDNNWTYTNAFFRTLGLDTTIKDITFDNAYFGNSTASKTNNNYAVVVGCIGGNAEIVFDNVNVTNSTVKANTVAGILVGRINGSNITIKNCDVEKSTVIANGVWCGALVGYVESDDYADYNETENNTVKESVLIIDGEIKTLPTHTHETSNEYVESTYVAQIGDKKYSTLFDALAAAQDGDTVKLINNVTLTDTLVIPAGKKLSLNLNDKTISATHGADYSMIHVLNGAELTIKGDGTISYAAGGNNIGAAIWVEGKLTLDGGIIDITGAWTLGFAVDVRPNAWGTAYTTGTSFVMNGGTVKSTDTAVRVASNSSDSYAELGVTFTMNGGSIESAWDAIFVQHLYNGDLDIKVLDGTVSGANSAMRIYGNAGSDIDMIVSGGNFTGAIKVADAYVGTDAIALSGGTYSVDVSEYCADGYKVMANSNGTYGVVEYSLAGSGTAEDPYLITSVEDFIFFAKQTQAGNTYSGKIVKLAADIDFAGANYLEIAEDGTIVTDYRIPKFSGTFDGGNYTIKNFNFDVKCAYKGYIMMFSQDNMWAYIKNLKIENVNVTVADITGETRITALANRINAGGMTSAAIENVHITNYTINCTNTTSSNLRIGGFAYFVQGSQLIAKDCSITNFTVNANGAILLGGAVSIVKSKCDFINVDVINAVFNVDNMTNVAGGFVAQTQDNGTGTTFTDCDVNVHMNFGTIATDIGGFVASVGAASQFYNCTTSGTITVTGVANGKSVGGFVGDLGWNGMGAPNTQHEFNDCVANVKITAAYANVGGFIGDSTIADYPERFIPAYFNDCEAKGDVSTVNGVAGGFVGRGDRGIFTDCIASGNVKGRIAGGFWGEIYPKAKAEHIGGWSYDKKEVTHTDANAKSIVLEGVNATGTVEGTEYEAQLIGFMKDKYVGEDNAVGYATPIVLKDNKVDGINRYQYPLQGSGTKADPYQIGSLEDLIIFRDSVNAGETKYNAEGVYVVLTADIDLSSVKNWAPIGTFDYSFDGNFNGQGHKIMNLKMSDNTASSDYAYLGFFGVTANNTIENFVIENVTINSNGQIVAAAIAYPYYTTVDKITVRGNININGGNYTAGVLGYTRHCVNASNLTVAGNAGSTITGNQTVGGIIADIQMNGGLTANYSNFSVSGVKITGTKNVGGISGIISGQTLDGATVKNVVLVSGDTAGIVSGNLGATSTIKKVTSENVNGAEAVVGGIYGNPADMKLVENDGTWTTKVTVIRIYTWEDLKALDALVESGDMLEGVTVLLMNDIDLSELGKTADGEPVSFSPIGANSAYFKGTFDGQGHTIKNMYQNGWALGYDWYNYGTIGLFAYIWNATIKNLTIENAECLVEGGNVAGIAGCAWGNCTFENITIKNSTFATYNNRAGGIVGYTGGKGTFTFKNILVDNKTVIAGLWGSFDSSLGGIMGQLQSASKAVFENVTVECRLDAYNDVTAAYKYYAYRMCGMLIGNIPVDANNQPILDNVTIGENVKVNFGDWALYTYINTPDNGWQRVEKGYAYDGVDVTLYPNAEIIRRAPKALFGGQQYGCYGQAEHENVEVTHPFEAVLNGKNYWYVEDAIEAANLGDTILVKKLFDASIAIIVNKSITMEFAADVTGAKIILAKDAVLTAPAGLDVATDAQDCMVKYANGAYTVVTSVYKVSTKAELNAALAAAEEGATILFTADIDYGTDQLALTKAITLDLGDHTLTTRNAYGGMSVKNNATVKNGTIVHASNNAAIKVWNATAFEDLVIDVQGKGDANKTIGGIVLQSGSTTRVGSIKNVTIKGAALTNGIETYNCGDATENVIGSMENVTIEANGTAMLISAPVGTATNCTFKGGVNGIEIWIKGNYSASLALVNSTVKGGVYAHDEFSSTPGIVNKGTLSLTVSGTTLDDITLTLARAENVAGVLKDIKDNAQAKVNNTYYATLAEAMAAAKAGDVVTVFAGTYAMPSMKAGITIVGVGEVMFEGTLTGTLENLTLKNIHIKGDNAQRWAYAKGNLVFENVTFEATGVYALHFDGITAGTNILYKDCTIIGWAAMSGSPESVTFDGCTIKGNGKYAMFRMYFNATIKDCTFDVSNTNASDKYHDGIEAVENAVVTVINCTNVNGSMADILNTWDAGKIVVDGTEYHWHDYSEGTVVTAPTCISKGYTTYTCDCGYSYKDEEVDFVDHNMVDGTCSVCKMQTGTWGGIDWTLYADGTLVIAPTKGTPVPDKNAPAKRTYEVGEWRETVIYKSNGSASAIGGAPYDMKAVKKLIIEEGVTMIGSFTCQFPNLTGTVVIPSTVSYIGQEAFHKTPITELIFAAGGTEGLCIANGAFKKTLITEVSFPGDREYIHIHHWAFGGSTKLETAYIPANVTKCWGGEHVDYFDNFNSQTNVSWTYTSSPFTGCTAMQTITFENEAVRDLFFGSNRNSTAEDPMVAYAGLTAYNTFAEALEAALEDGVTLGLAKNVTVKDTIVIPAGKTLTLNLNGKTITGTDNATGSFGLITNKGELTITDTVGNGKITLTATNNRGWNAYSSVISNTVGGKLVVNGGTIEHLGGTAMAYAIDNLTNGKGTYAETVINGGTIKSTYRAIRQFLNGVEAQNILTINGGTIEGANKSVWMQDPSTNANSGKLTIGADAQLIGDVYLFVTAGSKEWPVEVSIAEGALQGESTVVTGNVPNGYAVENKNGAYGVTKIKVVIKSSNLLLGNTIGIYFNIDMTTLPALPADAKYTAVVTKNGKGVEFTVDWINGKILINGLAAKQMYDEFTVVIMVGNVVVSEAVTDSVAGYVNRGIEKKVIDAKDPFYTALLAYGKAAADAFNSDEAPTGTLGAGATLGHDAYNTNNDATKYYGASLNLNSNIEFNFKFYAAAVEGAHHATITYVYADGNTTIVRQVAKTNIFATETKKGTELLVVKIADIPVEHLAYLLTCTVYDEAGNVIAVAQDSVYNYCDRAFTGLKGMMQSDSDAYDSQRFKLDFYKALADYVAAAKSYADKGEVDFTDK